MLRLAKGFFMKNDIVIAGACRTPVARLGGAMKDLKNQDLGALLLGEVIKKNGIAPDSIDEVVVGCVGQQSDAHNLARVISLKAGLPFGVTGQTVNRNCASGMQAIVTAAQMIESQDADIVMAGGVEVMSSAPYVNRDLRFGKKLRHSQMADALWEGLYDPVAGLMMGETAEILAQEFKISRSEQDQFAVMSHQKAISAIRSGKFNDEVIPVSCAPRGTNDKKAPELLGQDEGPVPNLTEEMLSEMKPVFKEGGTVTAGNACPISDGAALMVITTIDRAKSLGLKPMGLIKGWAFAGVDPRRMGMGPTEAIKKVFKITKLSLKDIGLIEINESFAAQYLACEKQMGLNREKVNVNGGAIALGHPVGASGARIVVTMLHEMARRKTPLGLASLCVGGGQGSAVVIEGCF